MSTGPRVLLLTLSERTSGRGNRYLSGWLGKASVVAFPGEPDKFGNETWNVYVSEPEQRAGQQQSKPEARRAEAEQEREVRPRPEPTSRSAGTAAPGAAANRSASPVARDDG